jgi:hypothetical protein
MLRRVDAGFPGFEILLRKTSPENWNVKFHRLDQPGPEFSDLPRCPLRLCGYGLSLVPLVGTTFRWVRNANPPGVIAAARGSDLQGPVKQVQVILDDAGSKLALGQGVTKTAEVLEVGEGSDARQWIIETPLFCAVWPSGLDLRSPLASKTRFDLVGPQEDGTLVFVQSPSRADDRVLAWPPKDNARWPVAKPPLGVRGLNSITSLKERRGDNATTPADCRRKGVS